MKWRNWKLEIWALLLFGGSLIRLFAAFYFQDQALLFDAGAYLEMASQLANNEAFEPYWPPGLSYYLAVGFSIFGKTQLTARLLMIFFYVVLVFLLRALTAYVGGEKVTNFAIAYVSFVPTFIFHSITPLTHLPMAVCITAVVLLVLYGNKKYASSKLFPSGEMWTALTIGILLGAGILIRPSTLLLALGLIVGLVLFKKKWQSALLSMLGILLVVSPWLWKAHKMTGDIVPINYANAMNIYLGNHAQTPLYKSWWYGSHDGNETFEVQRRNLLTLPGAERNQACTSLALTEIREHPGDFFIRTLSRTRTFFAFDTFTGATFLKQYTVPKALAWLVLFADALAYCVLGILGLTSLFFTPQKNLDTFFAAILLLFALPYFFSFSHPTYHFALLPLLAIVAGRIFENKNTHFQSICKNIYFENTFKNKKIVIGIVLFCTIQIEWIIFMI